MVKEASPKLLSQRAYAAHRGVRPSYINKLVSQGVLRLNNGRVPVKESDDILDRRKAGEDAKATTAKSGRQSGERPDLTEERARLTKAQADKAELEAAKLRGELLPAEAVAKTWEGLVANCRAKLLSLPTKAAPQVAAMSDPREVEGFLKGMIFEALEELSGYDPDRLVGEPEGDGEAGACGMGPASESDGKPVGGRRKTAQRGK